MQSLSDAEDIDHHLPQWLHMERYQGQHSQWPLEAASNCDLVFNILLVLLLVAPRLNIPSLAREVGESGEQVTSIGIAKESGPILSTRATYSHHNVGPHTASEWILIAQHTCNRSPPPTLRTAQHREGKAKGSPHHVRLGSKIRRRCIGRDLALQSPSLFLITS